MMQYRGQGATEYLVLLAVVLIVALVSVALLGFFPGMASDAQMTQSKTYWASAQPIAITEMAAMAHSPLYPVLTMPYLRVRNTGAYPIRIIKLLDNSGHYSSMVFTAGALNISDYYYLAPGEEKYFADTADSGKTHYNVPVQRYFVFDATSTPGDGNYYLHAASSVCSPTPPYGTVVIKNFGFEYIEYIDNQPITKREIGKDLIIQCSQSPP